MSLDQIFNGDNGNGFIGLIPQIIKYVDDLDVNLATKEKIGHYMKLISRRASGELPTTATWMRNYIFDHKDYKHDGKLTSSIVDELMELCSNIGLGLVQCPALVGEDVWIKPIDLSDETDEEVYLSTDLCTTIKNTEKELTKRFNDNNNETKKYIPLNQ